MKWIEVVLVALLSSTVVFGQDYDIKSETLRISNKKYDGFASQVDGAYYDVEEFWLDYLKEYSKVRRKRNYYEVSELSIKDLGVDTLTYVTRVESFDSLGRILIAPFSTELSDEELKVINADLEKILKLATRAYYVNNVQKKIDQSEAAAIVVSKNHQKLIYQGENLVDDLDAATTLKAELEARLEETILKIKVLNQQIIDNKAATEATYEDLEQIKQVIESHKASLKKIK
jgi:uncharacterized protein YfkK (UPF0435 family)